MIWAIRDHQRVRATPNARAACPCCNAQTIAKCGSINIWHWAHKSTIDCDPWYEPESNWHLNWKARFPDSWQEIIMGPHRADIQTPSGRILEFQASPISTSQIAEREAFYRNMLWILKGEDFAQNFDIRDAGLTARLICDNCNMRFTPGDDISIDYDCCPVCGDNLTSTPIRSRPYWTFRWHYPRRSWFAAKCPIAIDHEGMLFFIKKLYADSHCAGWGTYQRISHFVDSQYPNYA